MCSRHQARPWMCRTWSLSEAEETDLRAIMTQKCGATILHMVPFLLLNARVQSKAAHLPRNENEKETRQPTRKCCSLSLGYSRHHVACLPVLQFSSTGISSVTLSKSPGPHTGPFLASMTGITDCNPMLCDDWLMSHPH